MGGGWWSTAPGIAVLVLVLGQLPLEPTVGRANANMFFYFSFCCLVLVRRSLGTQECSPNGSSVEMCDQLGKPFGLACDGNMELGESRHGELDKLTQAQVFRPKGGISASRARAAGGVPVEKPMDHVVIIKSRKDRVENSSSDRRFGFENCVNPSVLNLQLER